MAKKKAAASKPPVTPLGPPPTAVNDISPVSMDSLDAPVGTNTARAPRVPRISGDIEPISQAALNEPVKLPPSRAQRIRSGVGKYGGGALAAAGALAGLAAAYQDAKEGNYGGALVNVGDAAAIPAMTYGGGYGKALGGLWLGGRAIHGMMGGGDEAADVPLGKNVMPTGKYAGKTFDEIKAIQAENEARSAAAQQPPEDYGPPAPAAATQPALPQMVQRQAFNPYEQYAQELMAPEPATATPMQNLQENTIGDYLSQGGRMPRTAAGLRFLMGALAQGRAQQNFGVEQSRKEREEGRRNRLEGIRALGEMGRYRLAEEAGMRDEKRLANQEKEHAGALEIQKIQKAIELSKQQREPTKKEIAEDAMRARIVTSLLNKPERTDEDQAYLDYITTGGDPLNARLVPGQAEQPAVNNWIFGRDKNREYRAAIPPMYLPK